MSNTRSGFVPRGILPQRRQASVGGRGIGLGLFAGPGDPDTSFLRCHFWWPLAMFASLVISLAVTNGDARWADWLFAWEGHHWVLKSGFVTESIIHVVGRDASAVAWVGVAIAWIISRTRQQLARWRRPLAYLALSVLIATALVAWFKSWSNMDCPWDLLRYGGERPYIGLLQLRPIGLSRGSCFPAGHASAGYAWTALYFFFRVSHPQWRWRGLAAGVGSGLLFGLSQQLRGAHFLSHDLWTAAICWMVALATYRLLYPHEVQHIVARPIALAEAHGTSRRATTEREPWALPS